MNYERDIRPLDRSDPEKAVGLGLHECNGSSAVVGDRALDHSFSADWLHDANMPSPIRLKVETENPWMYHIAEEQHLRQPCYTSTSFPTPTEYTSASSHLSPATSRLTHSTRTSISSVYDSHGLTSSESFDPMLTSQTHVVPQLAWSAPPEAEVAPYTGMHDLSLLAASPATSVPDDYNRVYFSSPCTSAGMVTSTPALDPHYQHTPITVDSSYSSEDGGDDALMLHDRPPRRRRKPTTEANAKFSCGTCGKLFQRSHNLKMHHKTHDRQRFKEHKCPYLDCDKEFDRKADLVRHDDAVGGPPSTPECVLS